MEGTQVTQTKQTRLLCLVIQIRGRLTKWVVLTPNKSANQKSRQGPSGARVGRQLQSASLDSISVQRTILSLVKQALDTFLYFVGLLSFVPGFFFKLILAAEFQLVDLFVDLREVRHQQQLFESLSHFKQGFAVKNQVLSRRRQRQLVCLTRVLIDCSLLGILFGNLADFQKLNQVLVHSEHEGVYVRVHFVLLKFLVHIASASL